MVHTPLNRNVVGTGPDASRNGSYQLGSVSAPTGHGQCWAGGMATHADTRGEYANDRRGRQYSSSQSGIHSGQSKVLGCEWVAAEYSVA